MRIKRQALVQRKEGQGEIKGGDSGQGADINVRSMFVEGTWRVAFYVSIRLESLRGESSNHAPSLSTLEEVV